MWARFIRIHRNSIRIYFFVIFQRTFMLDYYNNDIIARLFTKNIVNLSLALFLWQIFLLENEKDLNN